ncbi:MAG TPA: hypothetical protein DIU37_05295 [Opitutae bacterium]|nr:hypothetical protein [Opitutae bacterium]|tara:strand:+ start:249 stop:962 length:714 start_codon:yes stop_codon:yes gene_type:complete
MTSSNLFDQCKAYINSQGIEAIRPLKEKRPTVTLSRMAGSRGVILGDKLAQYLQEKSDDNDCPWTVFDKKLIEKVLEDHDLPARLEKYLPEDSGNELQTTISEILGLHPSIWTLVQKASETIYTLARKGHVILVGRGANIIASTLPNTLHVRLVGSFEKRAEHVSTYYKCSLKEAESRIQETDKARAAYVKKYFDRDLEDPLQYTITLNTDNLSDAWIVKHVGDAVLNWDQHYRKGA